MIYIHKGNEPFELKKKRLEAKKKGLSPNEAYKTLSPSSKKKLKKILVSEQGGLCAYCMCKIPRDDVDINICPITIEHILPQIPNDATDVEQGLDYLNLVAVCNGNRASSCKNHKFCDLTCDAHKKNDVFLKINPTKAETLTSIYYTLYGEIESDDPDVKYDLQEILNLNSKGSPLVSERKAVLDTIIADMEYIDINSLSTYCQSLLDEFQNETDNKTPYVGIIIWYLNSMLEGLSISE